ncbi:MAG: stage II sporulation protein M [Candidatus Woesearchaeota archaeon]|nr:stage II sporulation protein M [Candidatus Woesearchaeota archaeon]
MYSTIKYEEKKDLSDLSETSLLKEHSRAISFLTFLFLGITVSFTLWYVFLPFSTAHNLFSIQIETIKSINSTPTMHAINSFALFSKIIINNMKVLLFCIVFALFYGAGAIFILTWNASVIAVAIGTFIRNKIAAEALALGFSNIGAYMHIFSLGLLRYLLHGIPEIIAYFIGGLAGGILSIAVIKKDFRLKRFEMILLDVADLILISIAFLIFGALLEVYVTPLLFN